MLNLINFKKRNDEISSLNKPELINGIFTVNRNGKKVKFTKGNLFWNGKEFRCEKNQYDYPKIWNKKHIGNFFWSKNASIARASKYSDNSTATTDKFFAADGGAIDGYTVLSSNEWNYLFRNALAENSSGDIYITIAGINCIVLKPDGFNGTVADSYTAEQWAEAEEQYGLVALPVAGCRDNTSFIHGSFFGHYWSGTPYSDCAYDAYDAYFDLSIADSSWCIRGCGCSVRLVQAH